MKKETIEEIIDKLSIKESKDLDLFLKGVQWEKDRTCNHNYILTSEDGHRVIECQKCDNVQPI